MNKTAKIALGIVAAIILVVLVAYAVGVRVWVSDGREAATNQSAAAIGALGGPAPVKTGGAVNLPIGNGLFTFGFGGKTIDICAGCSATPSPNDSNDTDYSGQAQQQQDVDDRDTGSGSYGDSSGSGDSGGDSGGGYGGDSGAGDSGSGDGDSGGDSSGGGGNIRGLVIDLMKAF